MPLTRLILQFVEIPVEKEYGMSEFSARIVIDGCDCPQDYLDRLEYDRTLHVLHEMKYLGATVRDGEKDLSHEDINWLEPDKAKRVCFELRASLDEQKMLDLFEGAETDAERRWKEFNENFDPSDLRTSVTEISIVGATFQDVMAIMNGVVSDTSGLSVYPEHYIVIGDVESGQRGMEAFGMFGEPTFVHGIGGAEIPEGFPSTPTRRIP